MSFVSFLNHYLHVNGLTKKDFAKKAGISVDALGRFMRGEGIMLVKFEKIVAACDREIHLHPKKK